MAITHPSLPYPSCSSGRSTFTLYRATIKAIGTLLPEDPSDDAGDRGAAFQVQVSLNQQASDPMSHTLVQSYAYLSGSYSLPTNPMVDPNDSNRSVFTLTPNSPTYWRGKPGAR